MQITIFFTLINLKSNKINHLWSAKASSPSALSVPAVANMMVVSRSPIIPLTVLAALIQAWVPRDPACSAASTLDTYHKNMKIHQVSAKGRRNKANLLER